MEVRDLFGTDDSVEATRRFEAYKAALDVALVESHTGIVQLAAGAGEGERRLTRTKPVADSLAEYVGSPDVMKALDSTTLDSIKTQLEASRAATADVAKDFSLTSPLSTGFVPFDLEAPAKLLTPRPTPLRNRIPRLPGSGTARRYKRLTGFSGTGTGGLSALRPGITDSTSNTFGAGSFNRGPKISYASDEKTIPYQQFSLSDNVPWSAQFSGQGFQDIRQLSQTSTLYASMLSEERVILGGRGTASGYVGAISAPTIALAARTAGTGETKIAGGTQRVWARVTALSQFGESAASAAVALNFTDGQVEDVTITPGAVDGALGYRVYVALVATGGADPGAASCFAQGTTGYNTFTIQGTMLATGDNAGGAQITTSAAATEYDGILTYLGDVNQAGYLSKLNAAFSTSNPGTEFQAAFSSLYDSVKADPDEILFNGFDRVQLSDLLKTASSANYRLAIQQSEVNQAVIGSVVTGILNGVTGKMVDASVHPWMYQGNAAVLSWTLPIPDTQVSNVIEIHNVQDYMAVQWPVIDFNYSTSTYWYGTMTFYAPAWCGMIQRIKKVTN